MAEQSRNEEILRSIIDETEYDKTPQSREEELLLELKQAIEGGGSNVVPNPEGEATETLNKLGIDDTVYEIPKELPAVTSADAGNVLGVNSEGQWTKMAASGGFTFINGSVSGNRIAMPIYGGSVYSLSEDEQAHLVIKAGIRYNNRNYYVYLYRSFDDLYNQDKKIRYSGIANCGGDVLFCSCTVENGQSKSWVYDQDIIKEYSS